MTAASVSFNLFDNKENYQSALQGTPSFQQDFESYADGQDLDGIEFLPGVFATSNLENVEVFWGSGDKELFIYHRLSDSAFYDLHFTQPYNAIGFDIDAFNPETPGPAVVDIFLSNGETSSIDIFPTNPTESDPIFFGVVAASPIERIRVTEGPEIGGFGNEEIALDNFVIANLPTCASDLTVDTLVDENDGDLSLGDVSLREAIAYTLAGGTVHFDASLAGGTIQLTQGELVVNKALTIEGLGANNLTIDANNSSRVFKVDDGDSSTSVDVTIEGLTIAGGGTDDDGGGIFNAENLALSHTTFYDNFADFGGGLHNEGEVTIEDSLFDSNNGTDATGIHNRGDMTISRTTISNNGRSSSPSFGGGLTNNGTLKVYDSTISGNLASHGGGGISNSGGTLEIFNSTISGNSVEIGGWQEQMGGGIYNSGTLTVTNSTVTDNEASQGGGIFSMDSTSVTIENSIIAGNTDNDSTDGRSPDVFGELNSTRYNLIGDGTGSTGFTHGVDGNQVGTSANPIDPQLGPLQDNGGSTLTHALTSNSRAIDAGDPNTTVTTDQRGISRPQGDGFDIGAFEIEQERYDSITVNSIGDMNAGSTVNLDHVTLREAIEFTRPGGTINFDPSLAGSTIQFIDGPVVIDKDLTINGLGADQLTVQASYPIRVFVIDDGDSSNALDVNIQGLTLDADPPDLSQTNYPDIGGILNRENLKISDSTIQNGNADRGGAILNEFGNIEIVNSTISHSNADADRGGGIYNEFGNIEIVNSTISHSSADYGGGIFNDFGNIEIVNSTISHGNADDGGGIFNTGTLTIAQTTFAHNWGGFGGGIHNEGQVTIEDSLFDSNEATDGAGINNQGTMSISRTTIDRNGVLTSPTFGGGIRNLGSLEIVDSTISRNAASLNGGGIYNVSTLEVVNSTISGNSAKIAGWPDEMGGGIYNSGTLTVRNSTVTDNEASQGGGIFSMDSTSVTIENSIIAGNTDNYSTDGRSPDVAGDFHSTDFNLIGDGTGSTGFTHGVDGNQVGTSANPIDPQLGPLQDNGGSTETHALLPGSRAIDAADPTTSLFADQRNVARPQGNGFDIGAFELEMSPDDGTVFGTSGDNHLVGTPNADTIDGLAGNDDIRGRSQDDRLIGSEGNDTLVGQAGHDTLLGGNNHDRLYGEAGDDVLQGGDGNDYLLGWKGNDTVSGGAGSDVFVLEATHGTDIFVDFVVGEDRIRMKDGLGFSELSITQNSGNTLISYNSDTLAILNGVTEPLTAASFV